VKYEARQWLERSKWTTEDAILIRVEDGVVGDSDLFRDGIKYSYKPATLIPWED
jgi:hypothetical protein